MQTANGPAPEPAAIKELKGNPGKRPIKVEIQPTKGAPVPPADLKGEAFAEWARIVPELEKVGILCTIDRAYLVAYVEAWSAFCEARESLHTEGATIMGRDGGKVRNPAAVVMKDSLDMMLKFGAKFGLSPADRARLAKAPEPEGSKDDATAEAEAILS